MDNNNTKDDYAHLSGSSPTPLQYLEELNGLPTVGLIDRMLEHSRESQIQASQVEHRIEQQQQQTEQPQSMYSHLFQLMHENQDLQDQITQSLARLEEARLGTQHHIQRLERHLQEHQQQQQHQQHQQRLRHRLRRHQQRRLARQVQSQLQQQSSGISAQLPKLEDWDSSTTATTTIHPEFRDTLTLLSRKLWPFVHYPTGRTHPDFPKSLLSFHLLTSQQLDSLALYFDQVYPPNANSFRYPLPVKPWLATNGLVRDLGVGVGVKRRRFGRFIGLRGCESPVRETGEGGTASAAGGGGAGEQESMVEQIERDWERRRGVWQAEEDERFRDTFQVAFVEGI
ncbi:hypothetical protein BJX76DRAFT_326485 [Aspergillus varians]